MDYGQNSQYTGSNNQPFFTAGAGSVFPNTNYFESENNLDTNQLVWDQLQSERDYRGIGNKAISPFANAGKQPENSERDVYGTQAENVADQENDPLMPPTFKFAGQDANSNISHNTIHVHMDGDHLSSSTLNDINHAIIELKQTGNVSNFYDTIRGGVA